MAELVKAFVEARDDVKALIRTLQELNQNFNTFQKGGVKAINEFTKIIKRNEKTMSALVKEMHSMNENVGLLLKATKELK